MTSVHSTDDMARLLALSAERDLWQRVALAREREAYARGREDGYTAGAAAGYARCDAEWLASLAPARAMARRNASEATHAELDRRRWGPGGREHFGDPRPGDYRGGRDVA